MCGQIVKVILKAPVDGIVMSVHEETNVKQYTTVVTMIVYQKE